MGVLSNKIVREQLKPGDHIYSWRHAYIYAHHGIYIGDGNVVHFTRGAGQEIGTGTVLDRYIFSSSPSMNSLGNPCPRYGDQSTLDRYIFSSSPSMNSLENPSPRCGNQSMLDRVIKSCLDCFLSGGELYRFEYDVNPAFFLAQPRGGTCTLAPSDPPEAVLHRASYLLEKGFGGYDLFKNNCEDFAIFCKTGLLVFANISVDRSGQAVSFLALTSAIVSAPLRFLIASSPGLVAVGYSVYCMIRLVSDIGVRRDVTKVPVERLVASPGSVSGPDFD